MSVGPEALPPYGGGAPAQPDASVPPELMAMLGGGGADEQDMAPDSSDPADLLRQMLELAADYGEVEPDEEDKLAIEQVRTLLQKLLARNQKESDQALSGQSNPRTLRKAYAG